MLKILIALKLLTPVADLELYGCDETIPHEVHITEQGVYYCNADEYEWQDIQGNPLFSMAE